MIRSVAELLKPFVDEERKKLDAYALTHGPTIGAMYEGLTKELLQKPFRNHSGCESYLDSFITARRLAVRLTACS